MKHQDGVMSKTGHFIAFLSKINDKRFFKETTPRKTINSGLLITLNRRKTYKKAQGTCEPFLGSFLKLLFEVLINCTYAHDWNFPTYNTESRKEDDH